MKKKQIALLCAVLVPALLMLAACGQSDNYDAYPGSGGTNYEVTLNALQPEADYETYHFYDEADMAFESTDAGAIIRGAGGESPVITTVSNLSEKIIYTYTAEIETLQFNETITNLEALIAANGAFIENSSISGINYSIYSRGGVSYRYAYYTIRVPAENLNAITGRLSTLGNVVNQNSNAQNITAQFTDTESRLNSLRVQEERLLDMLSEAKDVPDLITIEARLSEIRYQIESLTSMLTNWQRQVDYSTLTLSISEVEEYKEIITTEKTYWERMGDGVKTTTVNVGKFFTALFMWIMVNAPILLILTIIGVVIYLIIKSKLRKSAAKRGQKQEEKAAAEAAYKAYYGQQSNAQTSVPAASVPVYKPPQTPGGAQDTLPEQPGK